MLNAVMLSVVMLKTLLKVIKISHKYCQSLPPQSNIHWIGYETTLTESSLVGLRFLFFICILAFALRTLKAFPHTRVHVHLKAFSHTHVHVHLKAFPRTRVHAHLKAFPHTCVQALSKRSHTHSCTHTSKHSHPHACTHTSKHSLTHVCTHTSKRSHTHIKMASNENYISNFKFKDHSRSEASLSRCQFHEYFMRKTYRHFKLSQLILKVLHVCMHPAIQGMTVHLWL